MFRTGYISFCVFDFYLIDTNSCADLKRFLEDFIARPTDIHSNSIQERNLGNFQIYIYATNGPIEGLGRVVSAHEELSLMDWRELLI